MFLGSNPTAVTLLGNFGNTDFPDLPVSFGGDTKAFGPFYRVSVPAELKYPTQGVHVKPIVDTTALREGQLYQNNLVHNT